VRGAVPVRSLPRVPLDRLEEQIGVERLREVLRGAARPTLLAELAGVERRQHHDGHLRRLGVRLQSPEDLEAVGVGEHHVEKNERERIRLRFLHRLLAIERGQIVEPDELDVSSDQRIDVGIVLDDQYLLPVRCHASLPKGYPSG
jgi:hypothetical protein